MPAGQAGAGRGLDFRYRFNGLEKLIQVDEKEIQIGEEEIQSLGESLWLTMAYEPFSRA